MVSTSRRVRDNPVIDYLPFSHKLQLNESCTVLSRRDPRNESTFPPSCQLPWLRLISDLARPNAYIYERMVFTKTNIHLKKAISLLIRADVGNIVESIQV